MAKIIGRLKDVGIAKESTRGLGELPTYWLPKSSINFEDKVLKARSTVNYGNINLEGNQALVARKHAEGDIEFDLFDDSFGLFLLNLLGEVQTSSNVPEAGVHTHDFVLQDDSQHQSLAVGVKEQGINDLMFRLSMLNSLSLSVVPDDVVKCTANLMSRVSSVASIGGTSYTAANKFTGRHLTFKIENLTSGLDAGTNIPIRSLELNIEKNLRLDHNTGTVEPEDILNQGFRITGSVELDYENRAYRDLALNGTYKAVRIQLVNNNVTIGASTNPEFRLDLSRVDFEAWEQVIPNDEIASQTFTFMALYDITNGDVINKCRLVNTESSY